jgi:hypothetical protein
MSFWDWSMGVCQVTWVFAVPYVTCNCTLTCCRTSPALAEQYIQDEVSGISERRRSIAAALIVFAVLVLIPMAPDVADLAAVGTPSNFI